MSLKYAWYFHLDSIKHTEIVGPSNPFVLLVMYSPSRINPTISVKNILVPKICPTWKYTIDKT